MRNSIACSGLGLFILCLALLACGDAADDAQQAVTAAKGLMETAEQAKRMGEAADKAAREAEAAAIAQAPAGASEQEKRQLVDQAKAIAALQAMGEASGAQPIVNWRQLVPYLPDSLGEYKADGDVDGRTQKAGGFKVTVVKRRYKLDKARANITITDTSMSPMLRAPFKMAAIVEEDSSSGYKKGTTIADHTAIVEWLKSSKRSKATLLAGDRFVLEVSVSGTDKDDAASTLIEQVNLDSLAKLKAEEPEAEG